MCVTERAHLVCPSQLANMSPDARDSGLPQLWLDLLARSRLEEYKGDIYAAYLTRSRTVPSSPFNLLACTEEAGDKSQRVRSPATFLFCH